MSVRHKFILLFLLFPSVEAERKLVLFNNSVMVVLIPVTSRLPLILKLDVQRKLLLTIGGLCQWVKRGELWSLKRGGIVGNWLYPSSLS